MNKNKNLSYFIGLMATCIAIIFDQYTKYLAITHLKNNNSIQIIDRVFQLHYLENRGAAFGIMQNQQLFFIIISFVILCFVCLIYIRLPHELRYIPIRICLILIVSGAIGNMIDRIRFNYVVDFFYFELIDFPIFNVADIYVTVACILIAFLVLFYYKEKELDQIFQIFSFRKKI